VAVHGHRRDIGRAGELVAASDQLIIAADAYRGIGLAICV
jgi:hypothetical protein